MRYDENHVISACMTLRHDFGLMPETEQLAMRRDMAQVLGHLPHELEALPAQWSTTPPTEPGGYWLTMPPATYFAARGASGYDRPTLEELAAGKDGHLRTMRGEGASAAALTGKGGRWVRVPSAPPLPEEPR